MLELQREEQTDIPACFYISCGERNTRRRMELCKQRSKLAADIWRFGEECPNVLVRAPETVQQLNHNFFRITAECVKESVRQGMSLY